MKKIAILLLMVSLNIHADVIYVNHNAAGNNNGTSWNDAFVSLQDALGTAQSGDDIWVATGTYYPDQGAGVTVGDRDATFHMQSGVGIYGGFNGTENSLSERNWRIHVTTLSGAIGSSDDGDNSRHVVTNNNTDDTAILDGITITQGYAFTGGGTSVTSGAGMINIDASPTVRNCVFINNFARYGSAVYSSGNGNATFSGCLFTEHDFRGLDVHSIIYGSGSETFINSKFINNTPQYRGAIFNKENGGHVTVINGYFYNNHADSGVGEFRDGGSGSFTNSTLIGNSGTRTPWQAGAVTVFQGGSVTFTNSIIWGNSASNGELYSNGGGTITLNHTILNDGNEDGTVDFPTGVVDGGNNLDANPNLIYGYQISACETSPAIDAGDNTANDLNGILTDLNGFERIYSSTVDIGASESQILNFTDNILYVDQLANGNLNGLTWVDAFADLQRAINIAASQCLNQPEIRVAEGTYKQNSSFLIDLAMSVKGGYPITGGAQDIDNNLTILDGQHVHRVITANHVPDTTVYLEGLIIQNGLHSSTGGGIFTKGDLNLNQVQVKNNTTSGLLAVAGGGIFSSSGDLNVTNSLISNNTVAYPTVGGTFTQLEGGGICTYNGDVTLTNSQVTDNTVISQSQFLVAGAGGGVFANHGQVMANNSLISGNLVTAPNAGENSRVYGGGVFTSSGSVRLINSAVISNSAQSTELSYGGGVYGPTDLQNSYLWNNSKSIDGFEEPSEHEEGELNAQHSLVKGMDLTGQGIGNLDATTMDFDPLFVNELGGDFRLLTNSPLIDNGNNTYLPSDINDLDGDGDTTENIPLDLDQLHREAGSTVDIGPYEFQVTYYVGGSVNGLRPNNIMILRNNLDDQLTITEDGPFVFATPVATGLNYDVIIDQPPNEPVQPCTVQNGDGTIVDSDITDVLVICDLGSDLIFWQGFD